MFATSGSEARTRVCWSCCSTASLSFPQATSPGEQMKAQVQFFQLIVWLVWFWFEVLGFIFGWIIFFGGGAVWFVFVEFFFGFLFFGFFY